jgi:hypothetical protein
MLPSPLMTKYTLDPIASMIWYQAVEISLDLDGPIAVELFLEGNRVKRDADGIKRPRKWRNFCQGKRTPKDIPGALNVFDIADRHVPGSSRWFRSTIWRALKGGFRDHLDIEQQLMRVPSIYSLLWPEDEFIYFDDFEGEKLPPLKQFRLDKINDCQNLEGIDLVEAVVLLLELGKILPSVEGSERALDLYGSTVPKMAKIPALELHFPDLFDAIENRYVPVHRTSPDEAFEPWQHRMPDFTNRVMTDRS